MKNEERNRNDEPHGNDDALVKLRAHQRASLASARLIYSEIGNLVDHLEAGLAMEAQLNDQKKQVQPQQVRRKTGQKKA